MRAWGKNRERQGDFDPIFLATVFLSFVLVLLAPLFLDQKGSVRSTASYTWPPQDNSRAEPLSGFHGGLRHVGHHFIRFNTPITQPHDPLATLGDVRLVRHDHDRLPFTIEDLK